MQSLEQVIATLRAAAQATRLRLLGICAHGELTVSEITDITGQSQPRVSRHLKLLCDASLLERFREQHWVYYRIPAAGAGRELAEQLLALLPPDDPMIRLDRQRLGRVLARRAADVSDFIEAHADEVRNVQDNEQLNTAILDTVEPASIGDMLDIGTGTGRMLRLLGQGATHAVGVDISREMVAVARNTVQSAGLVHCTIRHGDMYQLRFPDDSFDTVTIDQVLSRAEDPALVINEAARVLRPGGRLLIVDFSAASRRSGVQRLNERLVHAWIRDAELALDTQRTIRLGEIEIALLLARKRGASEQAA